MKDDDNFQLILLLVVLAFLIFACCMPGCDLSAELNKPVPLWLFLLN